MTTEVLEIGTFNFSYHSKGEQGPPCRPTLKSKGAHKMTSETSTMTQETRPNRGGLEGVVAATTALSKVEGMTGRLIYHGYNIHDLARTTTFEEIAYLLWL